MTYTTYKGVDIQATIDDGKLSGFCINGVAKAFESPAEAMSFIDGLDWFTAENGVIIEYEG